MIARGHTVLKVVFVSYSEPLMGIICAKRLAQLMELFFRAVATLAAAAVFVKCLRVNLLITPPLQIDCYC